MKSVDLLAACERGDEVRLEQLGWRPVLDALRWWPKRVGGAELAPYASLLGEENPGAIVTALRALLDAGKQYQPSPAEIYVCLHPPAEPEQTGAATQRRRDQTERAYAAVRLYIAAGEDICHCAPRSPQMTIDRDGVLRCPKCGYLEPGQYDQAMAADEPDPDDLPAPKLSDVAQWAADVQRERVRQGRRPSSLLTRIMAGDPTIIGGFADTYGLPLDDDAA